MRRLAAELLQKYRDFLRGGRREVKYSLHVNIRKAQPRETRTERFPNVFGGGAGQVRKRKKNRLVIGIRKFVRGEAITDFGVLLLIKLRSAKRRDKQPFDLGDRQRVLRFVHCQKFY